jgi:hypothetical protein
MVIAFLPVQPTRRVGGFMIAYDDATLALGRRPYMEIFFILRI